MKTHLLTLVTATAVLLTAFQSFVVAEEPVEVLREQIKELESDLNEPLNTLNEQYANRLNTMKQQAINDSDLVLAGEITLELEGFKEGTSKASSNGTLKQLQDIYKKESERIKLERAKGEVSLLNAYLGRLKKAQEESGLAGDTESKEAYEAEADATQSRIDEITKLVAASVPAVTPTTTTPTLPATEEDKIVFQPGSYRVEGTYFRMEFDKNGKYSSRSLGSGSWDDKGDGTMILNRNDEFTYSEDDKVWRGKVHFGREWDVTLKYIGDDDGDRGRDRDKDRGRGPFGRRD